MKREEVVAPEADDVKVAVLSIGGEVEEPVGGGAKDPEPVAPVRPRGPGPRRNMRGPRRRQEQPSSQQQPEDDMETS